MKETGKFAPHVSFVNEGKRSSCCDYPLLETGAIFQVNYLGARRKSEVAMLACAECGRTQEVVWEHHTGNYRRPDL